MSVDEVATKRLGTAGEAMISSLRLDTQNPRLAEKHRKADQATVADILRMSHDVLPIAQSVVDNGYFLAEPLLVIQSPAETDTWIVVEGNRRTAALMGLTDPAVREGFADAKWDELAANSPLLASDKIPVVIHENREAAQVEVGKIHVVGKLQWSPYAQARYVASRIKEGKSFDEVAHDLGIQTSKVRDLYRDLAVADQAREAGISTRLLERAFSLITVAMRTTKLRAHVDVPSGGQVKINEPPVPEDKKEELKELVEWVFGSEEPPVEPKITDSRQMSKLGKVVGSEIGLRALRNGDSLERAEEKIKSSGLDPRDRLIKRLTAGRNALREAVDDIGDFADDQEVDELIDEIESIAIGLQEAVTEAKA